MAARYLRDETEVTDSDEQESTPVSGQDTQSIVIVTNNDIHGSFQMQDMIADVLSTLNSIQSRNAKAN
jgi:hypothetical protein